MTPRRNDHRWIQPERRQRVRIVTLRNFGWLTIAMMVGFGAITIRSEMRGRHRNDYGRLYGRQMSRDIPAKKTVEVVKEASPLIADQTPAYEEPLLPLDAYGEPQQPATYTTQAVVPRAHDSRVAIVGGPEGVTVVQQTRKRPVLSGGFGR